MAEPSRPATRRCPYCREEILSEATLCKHCRSRVEPRLPEHGGICPLCKEDIHPEAIKCKHCLSLLSPPRAGAAEPCGCGDGGAPVERRGIWPAPAEEVFACWDIWWPWCRNKGYSTAFCLEVIDIMCPNRFDPFSAGRSRA